KRPSTLSAWGHAVGRWPGFEARRGGWKEGRRDSKLRVTLPLAPELRLRTPVWEPPLPVKDGSPSGGWHTRSQRPRSFLRRSVMRLLAVILVAGFAAGLYAAGGAKEEKEVKPAEAFKEWGDYFVGGVWTTTNAKGNKEMIRWEWILDKSFIRLTWD